MESCSLNTSWVNGTYHVRGYIVQICVALSFVSVCDAMDGRDIYFAQGDDADDDISVIHEYWLKHNCLQDDAVALWTESFDGL